MPHLVTSVHWEEADMVVPKNQDDGHLRLIVRLDSPTRIANCLLLIEQNLQGILAAVSCLLARGSLVTNLVQLGLVQATSVENHVHRKHAPIVLAERQQPLADPLNQVGDHPILIS